MEGAIFFLLFSDTDGRPGSMLYAATERVLAPVLVQAVPLRLIGIAALFLPVLLFDSCVVTQACTWHITPTHHRSPIGRVGSLPVSSVAIARFCSVRGFHDP